LEPDSSIPDISNEKQDLHGLRGAEPDESSAPLFATNFSFFLSVVLINRKKGGIFSVKEGFSKRGVLKEPQRLKKEDAETEPRNKSSGKAAGFCG
jgi:hypothetical protein